MTNTKMTKVQKFEMVREMVADNQMLVDFVNHEIELLKNKQSGKRGLTSTQKENIELKEKIFSGMENEVRYTATEIYQKFDLSSQSKATSLLTQLKNEGKVTRVEDKRKVYFVKNEI